MDEAEIRADEETDPGWQTPARKRLVGRRWLVAAVVFAAVRMPLNLIVGWDTVSFVLLLASMVCLAYGCRDTGWARGFEAGRRAPRA